MHRYTQLPLPKTKDIDVQVVQSAPRQKDLREMAQMLSTGAVKLYVDGVFKVEEGVEGLTFVERRKVTGKVVLRMDLTE